MIFGAAQDTMAENLLCNGDFETVIRNIVGLQYSAILAPDTTVLPCKCERNNTERPAAQSYLTGCLLQT